MAWKYSMYKNTQQYFKNLRDKAQQTVTNLEQLEDTLKGISSCRNAKTNSVIDISISYLPDLNIKQIINNPEVKYVLIDRQSIQIGTLVSLKGAGKNE